MTQKLLLVIGILIAGIAAWVFLSPLFIDEAVDEDLYFDKPLPRSVTDETSGVPEEDLEAKMMADAAAAPDATVDEAMPDMPAPQVVRRGMFRDADAVHKGSGEAIVYRGPDGQLLLRLENFRVTNGPDLVVYLAKHPDPKSAADVEDGGFISLGDLKGNVGSQNYSIPPEVGPEEFGSAVIWCELFGVLFSPAALETP